MKNPLDLHYRTWERSLPRTVEKGEEQIRGISYFLPNHKLFHVWVFPHEHGHSNERILFFGCAPQLGGILVPWPGIEPSPGPSHGVKAPSFNHLISREFPPDFSLCYSTDAEYIFWPIAVLICLTDSLDQGVDTIFLIKGPINKF